MQALTGWFYFRNLEAGRRQRQRELEAKREELEANRRELEAANNYIAQLERTISTEKEKSYRLRYLFHILSLFSRFVVCPSGNY